MTELVVYLILGIGVSVLVISMIVMIVRAIRDAEDELGASSAPPDPKPIPTIEFITIQRALRAATTARALTLLEGYKGRVLTGSGRVLDAIPASVAEMALTPDGSDGVYLQVHGSSRPRGDFDLVLYCAPGVAAKFDKRSELWFNATIDVVELEDRKVRVGATAEVIRDWQTELYRRETPEGR